MKTATIENRKAHYDYFIEDTLECGISLLGNEVKSIRNGLASIKESWCIIENGQLLLCGMHITKWQTANTFDCPDENRVRTLLAHKKEIQKLSNSVKMKGFTLIPLKIYFSNNGKCKVLIGLCKGKKLYDKRDSLKNKQIQLDIARNVK